MDEERSEVIQEFYQLYRQLQKKYNLRMQSHFSMHGGFIEIYKHSGRAEKYYICKVKEEDELMCYRRAISELKYYENNRRDKSNEDYITA